jgi:hypothetical protein
MEHGPINFNKIKAIRINEPEREPKMSQIRHRANPEESIAARSAATNAEITLPLSSAAELPGLAYYRRPNHQHAKKRGKVAYSCQYYVSRFSVFIKQKVMPFSAAEMM